VTFSSFSGFSSFRILFLSRKVVKIKLEKVDVSDLRLFPGQPHPAPFSFFRPPLVNQPLIRRPTIAGDRHVFEFLGDRSLYKLLARVLFYGLVTFTVLR